METKLKQKLPTTSPFEVIEKIVGNSHKAAERLFAAASLIVPSFRPSETSKGCMHGSRLFRYVKVNYPYKKKIQPKLY
jgi:hypothetical protein